LALWIDATLWAAADALRNSMNASLLFQGFFVKYISDIIVAKPIVPITVDGRTDEHASGI
jgi:hypothetical protein